MKGLLLLANGFEDTEALATLDCLRRSGLIVYTVSVTNNKKLLTQSNVYVEADFVIDEINYQEFDFLVCPGGKAVFQVLDKTVRVNEIVRYFISNNKLSAFICAAPHLPGKLGLLENKKYTCFPGCNTQIIGGKYYPQMPVVIDGNIITARSMAYSIDFALAIIEKLLGNSQKEKVENSIRGL